MGCDIHLYKEKQINGEWVTADQWVEYDDGDDDKGVEVPWENRFTTRNYQLFGLLSKGVRHESPFSFAPRGLPFDVSKEAAAESERWDGGGHSHSYLYLHELRAMSAFLKTATIEISGMKDADGLAALRTSIESGTPNWELLFPYCQSSNDPSYDHFKVDVPADFYVGSGLDEIIAGFDGVDGDNHRVVFFFDN